MYTTLTLEAESLLYNKPAQLFKYLNLHPQYTHHTFDDLYIKIAIIHTSNSRVLLLRRSPSDKEQFFALPGAKVDDGETVLEAIARAVKEETELSLKRVLGMFDRKEYVNKREFLEDDGLTWTIERKSRVQLSFTVECSRIEGLTPGGKPLRGLWADKDMLEMLEMTEEMRRVARGALGVRGF